MDDVQKADDWGQACERMAREHRRMVGGIGETNGAVERKLATALCAWRCGMISTDVILRRAAKLLLTEDEHMHLLLASMATAVRRWMPFDDHDTSQRQGVLREHLDAELEVAGVLTRLISLVCQEDDPSAQPHGGAR